MGADWGGADVVRDGREGKRRLPGLPAHRELCCGGSERWNLLSQGSFPRLRVPGEVGWGLKIAPV